MSEVNQKFAAYVTSIAFNLTLSKAMVVQLVQIATRPGNFPSIMRQLGMSDTAVPAMRQLERRGLCYAPDPEWPGAMKLTEAGELVFRLLQVGGLVDRIEEKIGASEPAP